MKNTTIPPYGKFPQRYLDTVDPAALAPKAWRPTLSDSEREKTYLAWRTKTLDQISSSLWPLWDESKSEWVSPDFASMESLTVKDFDLLKVIRDAGIFEKQPNSDLAASAIPSHREYFIDEDTGKLGDRYHFYDISLPQEQFEKFKGDIRDAFANTAGSVSIQFKMHFQRPRAYQMSKVLDLDFSHELAISSMTSSMSSGHCFQGCLVAAGIYNNWLNRGFNPSVKQLEALAQFGVDIGDRRVFAGVHYPSDNLSSWIMDLSLIAEVYDDPIILEFMTKAIVQRSIVYKAIKDSGYAEYDSALSIISDLSSSPQIT